MSARHAKNTKQFSDDEVLHKARDLHSSVDHLKTAYDHGMVNIFTGASMSKDRDVSVAKKSFFSKRHWVSI